MDVLTDALPLLLMVVLIGFSAFFSASEAALFSLHQRERNLLRDGKRSQRVAFDLLEDPDRLLSAVLFWNLVVNIVYFALASQVGIALRPRGKSVVLGFTVGSVLTIIFFSEMLPKSIAVLKARSLSTLVSLPLAAAVRIVDPLMPALRLINLLSRRLIWPTFEHEAYLETTDLARAIELSTDDASLVDEERSVLRRVVRLTDLRADECMRPRSALRTFRPPVSWKSVQRRLPSSGYLFITEPDSDEIVSSLELQRLSEFPEKNLERYAQSVIYIPWCVTAADAFEMLEAQDRDTAAIVNELGETIGVLTRRDFLDLVFSERSSRMERIFQQQPILPLQQGLWRVTGMTNLRALEEYFGVTLPESESVTVAGVMQESLQRLPQVGDRCVWGPFELEVIAAPVHGPVLVHVRHTPEEKTERS